MSVLQFSSAFQPNRVDDSAARKEAGRALIAFAILLTFFCLSPEALAQITTTNQTGGGDNLWTLFKGVLFGGWGMLASAVILSVGIFIWLRRGIGEGLLVMFAGFAIFIIPAMVLAAKSAGQAMATGT